MILLVPAAALEGGEKRVEGNNNNLVHRYDYIIIITIYIIKIIFSCHPYAVVDSLQVCPGRLVGWSDRS